MPEGRGYIVVDNPKERHVAEHVCTKNFPDLKQRGHGIWWKTVLECEECGKLWWAVNFGEDRRFDNKWVPLRWYHFKIWKQVRKARGWS